MVSDPKFAILITTRNRLPDLKITLRKLEGILDANEVELLICDDGSSDGTSNFLTENYPNVNVLQNKVSKGLIYSRNRLLNQAKATYAISLDDDAHFLSDNVLQTIENYFVENPNCGLISFRIFWDLNTPPTTNTNENPGRVKGFVGCGHVWKMSAWHSIPNYPEWFIFYGEEDFASYQLFKKNIEIHYLPSVLVHHRVNVASRKKNSDYQLRQRRSFRSGWYLYFMFYPIKYIPGKLLFTFWMQIKNKTFKGDFKATFGILQAIFDVLFNFPKLLTQSNRLSEREYIEIEKLAPTKVYWKPENET